MSKSNQKLKKSIDEIIGEEPIVHNEDKERMYQWIDQYEKTYRVEGRRYWLPRLASLILIIGMFSVGWVVYTNESTSHPLEETSIDEKENRIPYEQIRVKIEDIMSKYRIGLTMDEVQSLFGEGDYFNGQGEAHGENYEGLEYRYFTSEVGKDMLNPYVHGMDPYELGDVGISFTIFWYDDGSTHASINFFNPQKHMVSTIRFQKDGSIYEDGILIDNAFYQIDAHGFLVQLIADSISKKPEEVTEKDVRTMTSLTIDPTIKNWGPYDYPFDVEYMVNMENLKYLHTKMFIPIDVLTSITSLETLIIEDIGNLGDLEQLRSLRNLQYLDIYNTEISTVSRLKNIESLEEVVLNKEKVTDWEVLEEHGIKVTEK